jgi:hypothetical protein
MKRTKPNEKDKAYAATHARAIADLVLSTVLRGMSPDFVVLDDWMPRNNDKQDVHGLLSKALDHLSIEQQEKVLAWKRKNAA